MRKSFIDRLFLPTIVSLSTVVFALIILQRMLTQQQATLQASTNEQASLVKWDPLESTCRHASLSIL